MRPDRICRPFGGSRYPQSVGTAGLAAAGLGAVMILLFKGREKKNPITRTISGLGELYQVTGYLSDILSYARLFALGIATGVIASVFNELCKMLMQSPILILKILGIIVACGFSLRCTGLTLQSIRWARLCTAQGSSTLNFTENSMRRAAEPSVPWDIKQNMFE